MSLLSEVNLYYLVFVFSFWARIAALSDSPWLIVDSSEAYWMAAQVVRLGSKLFSSWWFGEIEFTEDEQYSTGAH